MKKHLLFIFFALLPLLASAQQYKTGDVFDFVNTEGITRTYKVVGENLIENPSFDNGTTGWSGGAGGALGSTDINYSGGVDGGAYIRPWSSAGKGSDNSIGTAWDVEVGKTYVFSFFLKNQTNTAAENPAGGGYIKVSMSNTYRDETLVLQPLPHVDAGLAWTQNTWVVTAEYSSLALSARWLGGAKCFDAFVLAEVVELPNADGLQKLVKECNRWLETYESPEWKDEFQHYVDIANKMLKSFNTYTVNEINAVISDLKEALYLYRMANASEQHPVDVTARFLKNSNFDNLVQDWSVENSSVGNGINYNHYAYFDSIKNIMCEIYGKPSIESSISQVVHNLPKGYYRLSVQCVMDHDVRHDGDKSGAVIFCNNEELDMVTKQITNKGASHENSYPETFEIDTYIWEDSIKIGFKGLPNAAFNYVAIDNFKLNYYGISPLSCLKKKIDNVALWLKEHAEILPLSAYNELETVINEARQCVLYNINDNAVIQSKMIELEMVYVSTRNVINLKKQLKEILNTIEDLLLLKYPGFDFLLAKYNKAIPLAEDAAVFELKEGLNTEEFYYDVISILELTIREYYESQSYSKHKPANYTFLIPNPNFEEKGNWTWSVIGSGKDTWIGGCRPNKSGGANRQGVDLWGWGISSVDVHQELTNLPNGLYKVSAELITQTGCATDQHVYAVGATKVTSKPLKVEGWNSYEWEELKTTDYAVVLDGKLTIGAASSQGGNSSEGWFQATNFKLYYHGQLDDDYIGLFPRAEVKYIINGNVFYKDSVFCGMKIPRIEAPQIEGYTFVGWEGSETMPDEDVIMIGRYEINKYNLRYIVDGKVFKEDSVTYQAAITPEATIPVKEGHTFIGWNNLPATMPASDVDVEALFKINKYCITYVIDNVVIATEFVEYGADIVLMEPPVKDGYTFAGWSYVPEKMPATDIMVIGVYTTNSYRLTYLVDGEVYNSDIVECGTSIVLPQEPVKEGYTFSGWDAVPEVMPDHEVVIKGSFVPNKYLVTFKIDGVIISSESLEYGSSITVPNIPEREGYTFNGWGEVAETVPATDVTYEGSYTINSYLLTFVVDGEIIQNESVQYGCAIVAPEPPVKEGHTFSGWGEVPATMPASDVTINATFTINKYLVTFEVDGIVVSSKTLEYGAAITAPTMPEREGYTFSGWNEVDATVPAGDVTYHATYTANTYNVYYFVGATLVHIAEVAYGETIPEYIYVPTAEGDVFMGWIGEAYDTMPAHDVTYTANIMNGIENLEINIQNSVIIYDLTGRKVTDTENLKGGIYIINGRKVVIK